MTLLWLLKSDSTKVVEEGHRVRDFLPLQPFGLSASGGAATFAARRAFAPKGAPACRTTNSASCTTSSTYKAAEKGECGVIFFVVCGFWFCDERDYSGWWSPVIRFGAGDRGSRAHLSRGFMRGPE